MKRKYRKKNRLVQKNRFPRRPGVPGVSPAHVRSRPSGSENQRARPRDPGGNKAQTFDSGFFSNFHSSLDIPVCFPLKSNAEGLRRAGRHVGLPVAYSGAQMDGNTAPPVGRPPPPAPYVPQEGRETGSHPGRTHSRPTRASRPGVIAPRRWEQGAHPCSWPVRAAAWEGEAEGERRGEGRGQRGTQTTPPGSRLRKSAASPPFHP